MESDIKIPNNEGGSAPDGTCSVCVAVHIRPLIAPELAEGCQSCVQSTARPAQVFAGASSFTYDHVFGGEGLPEASLYPSCVLPLVEGLFKGYNATVFAYGQTGSGKTYTMGSAFVVGGASHGVIPSAMDTIFAKIKAARNLEFTVRVGFVEILTDDIRDLLLQDTPGAHSVQIRELSGGGICLAGSVEKEVTTKAEMAEILRLGTLQRATAATGMNKHSSRSHAIFTITVEQRRKVREADSETQSSTKENADKGNENDDLDDFLCAKLHLVDLAGSERAKRTKAEGQRLKEGININRGLLALGNVISALSEGKSHVPYRDSKLTRMLQDSLGGNSRTVMIACVSPADLNLEESVNTLRYANRARNIRNKPVVNRDPNAAQIMFLRQQLAAARAEIVILKQGRGGDEKQDRSKEHPNASKEIVTLTATITDNLHIQISRLEVENAQLQLQMATLEEENRQTKADLISVSTERNATFLQLESLQHHASEPSAPDSTDAEKKLGVDGKMGILKLNLEKIADLETEVKRLKKVQQVSGAYIMSARNHAERGRPSLSHEESILIPGPEETAEDALWSEDLDSTLENDEEYVVEANAHRIEQQQAENKLEQLQQTLEAKQAQMARVLSGDGQMATLRSHYDRVLTELQAERDELQREHSDILQRMKSLAASKDESRAALESDYKKRLAEMSARLKGIAAKEKKYAKIEALQGKSQEACLKLQKDIMTIKQQKVQLSRQMEKANKEFQQWKLKREQEVMALRREGRKAAAHVQKLQMLQTKQQAVLRRKTEEAEVARRRLKEMVEVHQRANESRSLRHTQSARAATTPEAQPNHSTLSLRDDRARIDWLEHEIDMCCQSFELQRILEGDKVQRTETVRQQSELLARIKACTDGTEHTLLEDRLRLVNEKLQRESHQILSTQHQLMLAKAEEDQVGQAAAHTRRWSSLRNIVEARSLLKALFQFAVSQKSQIYDTQNELSEMREEVEILKVNVQAAQAEAENAKANAAAAQIALADALAARTYSQANSEASQNTGQPAFSLSADQGVSFSKDMSAVSRKQILFEDQASQTTRAQSSEDSQDSEDGSDKEEDLWDPQYATPYVGKRRKRSLSSSGPTLNSSKQANGSDDADSESNLVRTALEHPVLMHINHERSKAGMSPIVKLTVPILKHHLKGKTVNGDQWRPRSKKREDLLKDYRDYLCQNQSKDYLPLITDKSYTVEQCSKVEESFEADRDAGRKNDRGSEPWVEAQQSPLHASFARLKSRASQEHGSGVQREVRLMKTEEPKTPTAEFYSTVRQQCQAAMRRAQALRERMDMHGNAKFPLARREHTNGKPSAEALFVPAMQIPVALAPTSAVAAESESYRVDDSLLQINEDASLSRWSTFQPLSHDQGRNAASKVPQVVQMTHLSHANPSLDNFGGSEGLRETSESLSAAMHSMQKLEPQQLCQLDHQAEQNHTSRSSHRDTEHLQAPLTDPGTENRPPNVDSLPTDFQTRQVGRLKGGPTSPRPKAAWL